MARCGWPRRTKKRGGDVVEEERRKTLVVVGRLLPSPFFLRFSSRHAVAYSYFFRFHLHLDLAALYSPTLPGCRLLFPHFSSTFPTVSFSPPLFALFHSSSACFVSPVICAFLRARHFPFTHSPHSTSPVSLRHVSSLARPGPRLAF